MDDKSVYCRLLVQGYYEDELFQSHILIQAREGRRIVARSRLHCVALHSFMFIIGQRLAVNLETDASLPLRFAQGFGSLRMTVLYLGEWWSTSGVNGHDRR